MAEHEDNPPLERPSSAPSNLRTITREPDPAVLELLTDLLERARRGEITAVAVMARNLGGSESGQAGEWTAPEALYAVESWKHRMLHAQQSGLVDT